MRNFSKTQKVSMIGIITLLVIIGFSMIACENGFGSNPFEGTWTGRDRDGDRVTLTVGPANWRISSPDYDLDISGSYSYSGKSATIYVDGYYEGTASVSGNSLTIFIRSYDFLSGITLYK